MATSDVIIERAVMARNAQHQHDTLDLAGATGRIVAVMLRLAIPSHDAFPRMKSHVIAPPLARPVGA
jgi:hypothetical protein